MTHKHRLDLVLSQAPSRTSLIQPLDSSCLTRPSLSDCFRTRQTRRGQLAKAHQYKIGWRRCPVALFVALRSAAIHAGLPAFVCWASFDLSVQARYLATPDVQHITANSLRTRQKTCWRRNSCKRLRAQRLRLIEGLINSLFICFYFCAFAINKAAPWRK